MKINQIERDLEDDRDIRETLVDALEGEGYDVISAVDGVDARERLRSEEQSPNLILPHVLQYALHELLQLGQEGPTLRHELYPYLACKLAAVQSSSECGLLSAAPLLGISRPQVQRAAS